MSLGIMAETSVIQTSIVFLFLSRLFSLFEVILALLWAIKPLQWQACCAASIIFAKLDVFFEYSVMLTHFF